MSRITKVGIWLIPWLPVSIVTLYILTYESTGPRRAFAPGEGVPLEWKIMGAAPLFVLIFAVAFVAGIVILLVAFVQKQRNHSEAN